MAARAEARGNVTLAETLYRRLVDGAVAELSASPRKVQRKRQCAEVRPDVRQDAERCDGRHRHEQLLQRQHPVLAHVPPLDQRLHEEFANVRRVEAEPVEPEVAFMNERARVGGGDRRVEPMEQAVLIE